MTPQWREVRAWTRGPDRKHRELGARDFPKKTLNLSMSWCIVINEINVLGHLLNSGRQGVVGDSWVLSGDESSIGFSPDRG